MKSICVFCGSNAGKNPAYKEAALELGKLLAEKGIRLIYGGGKVGLMGAIADSVLAAGGEAIGVIPQFLVDKEVAHQGLTDLHIVESMHERKKLMSEMAEAFITMPGGIGSFEEFFEILTWGQLKLHLKPIALLNVAGYFDLLIQFLDKAEEETFLRENTRELILVEKEPAKLLQRIMQSLESVAPIIFDKSKI